MSSTKIYELPVFLFSYNTTQRASVNIGLAQWWLDGIKIDSFAKPNFSSSKTSNFRLL